MNLFNNYIAVQVSGSFEECAAQILKEINKTTSLTVLSECQQHFEQVYHFSLNHQLYFLNIGSNLCNTQIEIRLQNGDIFGRTIIQGEYSDIPYEIQEELVDGIQNLAQEILYAVAERIETVRFDNEKADKEVIRYLLLFAFSFIIFIILALL